MCARAPHLAPRQFTPAVPENRASVSFMAASLSSALRMEGQTPSLAVPLKITLGLCCQSTSHAPSWCLVEVQLRSTNFPMASLGISQIGLLHLVKQKLHQRVLSSGATSKAFCHADEGGWLHPSCLKDCQKYKPYAPHWNQEWIPAISASQPFLMQDLTV